MMSETPKSFPRDPNALQEQLARIAHRWVRSCVTAGADEQQARAVATQALAGAARGWLLYRPELME